MQFLLIPFLALVLAGCKTATRTHIRTEEAVSRLGIIHNLPQAAAFNRIEVALAEIYSDLPAVLKLKQRESGTFILKPLVGYQVGGAIGPTHHAPYTMKIIVKEKVVLVGFELGPSEDNGTWAPESEVSKIKAAFRGITERLARAIGGAVGEAPARKS